MTEPEEALVERAKEDLAAFGELYERYVERIYNYAYYRTSNRWDAEDLTARVFFQALNHLPRYSNRGLPFSAWLFTIAHNLVANWHRDRSRRQSVTLDKAWSVRQDDPFAPLELSEDYAAVRQAVAALSPERQHLIVLKFVQELPNAEIGRIMGRSEGAVKALLHRTLRALRAHLKARQNGHIGK